MLLILLRDLQYRSWRVVITILLIGIVVTLLFVMGGLVNQFQSEPYLATARIGGDSTWVVPGENGGPLTSPQSRPRTELPPVPDATPIFFSASQIDGERIFVAAGSLDRHPVPLREGRLATKPGEMVIDETSGFEVGDRTRLGGAPVEVVGVTNDATVLAGRPVVFVELGFGQDVLAGGQDVATAMLTSGTPKLPPGFRLMSPDQVGDDTLGPLDGAISSISLVQTLLWLITAIVIATVIYITALERTRDFAILKAVGGRTRAIAGSLLFQGIVITVLAVALGAVLQSFVAPSFPMVVRVPSSAWWQIPLAAVIVATIAGLAGMAKVRSTSPVEAFA